MRVVQGAAKRDEENTMIRVLQENIHQSETVNKLMEDIRKEQNTDILLICEQYRFGEENEGLFCEDEYTIAAIWIPKPERLPVTPHGGGRGFVETWKETG